jgi:nucleotide-binding universal stress UspA family protein
MAGYLYEMGPVICAVDRSEQARAAVGIARELAARLESRLLLLHVEPPTEAPGVSAAVGGQQRLRAEERSDAEALVARIVEEEGLGDDVELRAEIGPAANRVVEIARQEDAVLIVLGSRGHGDLSSAVLGSVSHAVAANASCPVVIVPPAARRSLR